MRLSVMLLLSIMVRAIFAAQDCKVADVKDFYNYISKSNPSAQEVEQDKMVLKAQIERAKQRPNPNINLQVLNADRLLVATRIYNFSAQHIVELGDKRGKRIELASAAKDLNESRLGLDLYNSNTRHMLYYQRGAQLKLLIKSIKEAIKTFDEIIGKLSKRKRLTPEESVSLSTLKMANNDYKIQLNKYETQLELLVGELQFVAGCEGISPVYHNLIFPQDWGHSNDNEKYGLMKLEDLKLKVADSQLMVERSLGYSNLEIGPSLKYQRLNGNKFLLVGVSITFDLPLFNTNDGGKAKAKAMLLSQKIKAKNTKNRLSIKRDRLLHKYNRTLSTYLSLPSLTSLERKHSQVERYFSRGIVSIPMTIESHRQQIEFLKSRFEIENDLIETLAMIGMIDGDQSPFKQIRTTN